MTLPHQLSQSALDTALEQYFAALAAGDDQSPAQRYRLEGYMLAAVHSGQVEREALLASLAALAARHLPQPLAPLAAGTAHPDPELQLPFCMQRAPVVPTTTDD